MMRLGPVARLAKATAGIDQRRSIPAFAQKTLRRSVAKSAPLDGGAPDVWIWADSFSDHFFPANGHAAIRYLESVGLHRARDPRRRLLRAHLDHHRPARPGAARSWRARSAALAPYLDSGVPVIGLEPSCLATLRSDAAELHRQRCTRLGDVLSLAELVEREQLPAARPHRASRWSPSRTATTTRSSAGRPTSALLERAGATVTRVAGCCGLAGNFGMEKGHYDVSVAVAETHLLPAVRAQPNAVVLADGMSCRVQLDDLADVPALHLAELLAQARR